MEIRLSQGKVALVEPEDAWLVQYRWSAVCIRTRGVRREKWYASRHANGSTVYMHRVIMGEPAWRQVDHINGDGLDNRRANLRLATKSEQQRNSVKKGLNRSSRYKGVYLQRWRRRDGTFGEGWRVTIHFPGRRINGWAATEEEAARQYNRLAREHFGPFAKLNVIEEA